MEFGYDVKHGAYQPHIVRAPTVPTPSPPATAAGPSTTSHGYHPIVHVSPSAPETSRVAIHQDKHGNIFIKGLNIVTSMCQ
jgi:hypothetical protein